jgi:hypothetical protein
MTDVNSIARKRILHAGSWGAALLALLMAGSGCADHVQSTVVACPCSQGVCCTSGVCASDENACEQATQALSSESVGHWTGYTESVAFTTGSDAVDLTLHQEADGSLAGEVIFGTGTPPPPPTDGTVGWPAGYFSPDDAYPAIGLMAGFPYHVQNVEWTALRLRFDTVLSEPWGPWCRLQSSVQWSVDPPAWSCSGANNSVRAGYPPKCFIGAQIGEMGMEVDCDWLTLCEAGSPACACNATSCDVGTEKGYAFDIALRGNTGDGSIRDARPPLDGTTPRPAYNLRLIRASN